MVEFVFAMPVIRNAVAFEHLPSLLEIDGSVGLVEPRRGAEGAGRLPVVRNNGAGCYLWVGRSEFSCAGGSGERDPGEQGECSCPGHRRRCQASNKSLLPVCCE